MKDINIYHLIPNTNPNWIVKNDMIYFRKLADIPLVSFVGDDIWVCLDRRVTKQLLILIKHFVTNKIDFFLSNRLIVWRDIKENDLPILIENYLRSLVDEHFFDSIFDMGFDYINNLTQFIIKYDCLDKLSMIFEGLSKPYYKRKDSLWCGNIFNNTEREDIKDFISTLEREIKLNILINI